MYREPYTCMKARLKLDINIYWPLIIIFVCLDMSGQFSVQAEVPPKLPEMALCAVCSTGGNTQKEPVKSWSKYQGEVFYFCSIGCKKHFDQDPLVIILGPIPRPLPDFSAQTLKGKTVHLKSRCPVPPRESGQYLPFAAVRLRVRGGNTALDRLAPRVG